MRPLPFRCSALAALALAVLPAGARATSAIALDLPSLAGGSDAGVHGRVTRVQSRWTRDGHLIVTDVEIAVVETLKGPAAQTVVVVQPGGQVGDIGQVVSGLASFSEGEEVVVFLERQGSSRFQVTGLSQGKFRVERSTDGRDAFAVPEASDATLVDPSTRAPVPSPLRILELSELKRQIRAAVRRAPPARGGGTP